MVRKKSHSSSSSQGSEQLEGDMSIKERTFQTSLLRATSPSTSIDQNRFREAVVVTFRFRMISHAVEQKHPSSWQLQRFNVGRYVEGLAKITFNEGGITVTLSIRPK